MAKDLITIKRKQLDKIKSLAPKDRLDMVEAIAVMDQYILSSCEGWVQLIYNPAIINRFNEEELKEFYDRFKKITLEFLEFDKKTIKRLKILPEDKNIPPSTKHYT